MPNINPVNILNYGAIGLGFLLAFLAYRLIAKEQRHDEPRPKIFRAVYVFMVFSVVLTVMGFTSEYLQRIDASRAKLAHIRSVLKPMLSVKSGMIGQIINESSLTSEQRRSLTRVVLTLQDIDQKIAEAIK